MQLSHLRLVNFRIHRHTDLTPSPGVNVLVGANAQGKSSLLEAVFVAATGRSFRAQHDSEMMARQAQWARIRATVRRGERTEEVDVVYRREGEGEQAGREIRVNGVPVRRGGLFGHLLVVVAAPDDDATVTGSPRLRRRLLDVLMAQINPTYYDVMQRYTRALLQRNRALRMRGGGALEAWDEQIAALGAVITARRRALAGRLAAAAQPIYSALTDGRETLEVEYQPSLRGDDETGVMGFAREQLSRRRAEEVARGLTLVGPHRDDLQMRVVGEDLRTFGSRGQHLAAMLAVHLAERRVLREETGEEPVLLLDDVLLALDETRQERLVASLRGAQALMTATTLTGRARLPADAAVYRVSEGTVEEERAHFA